MKKTIILICFIVANTGFSQYYRHVIANFTGAYGILEKDLNEDGNMDLLAAGESGNTVAYFINNGNGIFTQTTIDNNLTGARFIDAADFDADGDMDFAATGTSDLVWYLNDNGIFVKTVIESNLNDPRQVRLSDIGTIIDPATPDGDMDIGVLISGENYAAVYLNDGNNNFSRLNLFSVNTPYYLHGGDFDLDGSPDFLVSSHGNNEILWYKIGSWGLVLGGTVATNFNGAYGVEGGDIDLDGDDDVVGAASDDNEVAWFENVNGNGSSFTKHTIDNNLPGASYVHWLDIDNDGDKDIVATGYGDASGNNSQVVIYYNDGNQNFTKTVVDNNIKGAVSLAVQDFDGDGEFDIMVAGSVSNEIVLLTQNPNAIGTQKTEVLSFYPNPVHGVLHISPADNLQQIEIFDITGRKVLTTTKTAIDVSKFNKGYFLVKAVLKNNNVVTQKILVSD